jgi:hypothetical protein
MTTKRLITTALLLITIVAATFTSAFSQTREQKKEQKVFADIPQNLRARLIERLNLYVEYERSRQYEKLYSLLQESGNDQPKFSREEYVAASRKRIAEGYRSMLLEFKPTAAINLSLNDDDKAIRYSIWGKARFDDGGKSSERDAAIHAYWINGDWYFSGVDEVIID